jgi:hypothetical protein
VHTAGLIGAAIWVPINLLAIIAINNLGLAIPIAVWFVPTRVVLFQNSLSLWLADINIYLSALLIG